MELGKELHMQASDSEEEYVPLDRPSASKSFDAKPDEFSDPNSVYSTCCICYKKLKARIMPNSCLHKFCMRCTEEIILRTRINRHKRKCPVCRTLFQNCGILNVPSNDDDWKRADKFSWKKYSDGFRKKVYAQNLWVQDLQSGSENEFTPQFYKDNPLQEERLLRWLQREINILKDFSEIGCEATVIHNIQGLLTQHSIKSTEFKSAMLPFLGEHTTHFIHEFYSFASSFFDIHSFDDNAFYLARMVDGQLLKANLWLDVQNDK